MEHIVRVDDDYELWVEERGEPGTPPVLLIMGANASGLTWPDALVDRLAEDHRVIRYDHRDTGRSTRGYTDAPYAICDLALDAVKVLDGLHVDRAHVVGMSMGGTLAQLLLLDYPDRLLSATVFATTTLAFPESTAAPEGTDALPGPDPRLLAVWETMGEARDDEAEMSWRIEHWRLLAGDVLPFDETEFRDLEQLIAAHAGTFATGFAHALADQSRLDRGDELAAVSVPTLVLEGPADPVAGPPHAAHLAAAIGSARLVTIPGMGHALSRAVVPHLAAAISEHLATAERSGDDRAEGKRPG